MKIGIMTFWWSNDNYGQLLQCYALQKYLRNLGHDAFLIRYDSSNDILPKNCIRIIKKNLKIVYQNIKFLKSKKLRKFDEFRDKYISQSERIYKSIEELRTVPPEADMYIVGSDQVWSCIMSPFDRKKNIASAYFLDFGKSETKRISYAASWGTDKISDEYINFISPLLKKFNAVSVREESGLKLCEENGVKSAICVSDPTFLLSKDIYETEILQKTNINHKEKYLFLYLLNNTFNFDIKKIFDFAKQNELKVIYVTGNGKTDVYNKVYATIPEWLCYIKNAEYVVTNSFHCSVFSMIFQKQYAVIPLNGFYEKLNTRMSSLFNLCKIEERFLTDDFSILDIPYSVNFDEIKKTGVDYLNGVFNENC